MSLNPLLIFNYCDVNQQIWGIFSECSWVSVLWQKFVTMPPPLPPTHDRGINLLHPSSSPACRTRPSHVQSTSDVRPVRLYRPAYPLRLKGLAQLFRHSPLPSQYYLSSRRLRNQLAYPGESLHSARQSLVTGLSGLTLLRDFNSVNILYSSVKVFFKVS